MASNLNNFRFFNERFIPYFNQENAMDVDNTEVPTQPLIDTTSFSFPQEKALNDLFQTIFSMEFGEDETRINDKINNETDEHLFDFAKKASPLLREANRNPKWINTLRIIFQKIEQRIVSGCIMPPDREMSLRIFYNETKKFIPQLTDTNGYPIWLLLHHFSKCPTPNSLRRVEDVLQRVNSQFLMPLQALECPNIFILEFLQHGHFNEWFKVDLWKCSDKAFIILRFLKECQQQRWISLLLNSEKINNVKDLIDFIPYVNPGVRQKLVEKFFQNVKFLSQNEIELMDPPSRELVNILCALENITTINLQVSKSNPKKRTIQDSETEQSISKFAKTEDGRRGIQVDRMEVPQVNNVSFEFWIYLFLHLPRSLQVLDLTKIPMIKLSSPALGHLFTMNSKTGNLRVKLSTSIDIDLYQSQPALPNASGITIEWFSQNNDFPPIQLFPNFHHILHVRELKEPSPVINDMLDMISLQVDSELDELALPVLEKFTVLPRILIESTNLRRESLSILNKLLVTHKNLTIKLSPNTEFNFSMKETPVLFLNFWEQEAARFINRNTPPSAREISNAKILFGLFTQFVHSLPESDCNHYFAIALSLGVKIQRPLNSSNGRIVLEGFERLLASNNPDIQVLLYWAIEILKFPPQMTPSTAQIINHCFDLCFSYFDEDHTFFHHQQELRKKMLQEPLNHYLLHYLAEEKKGHQKLLETNLECFVSDLLKQKYPESSLDAWNKAFDKLYRMTPSLGKFYSNFQESMLPGHYYAVDFFIKNRIYYNSFQMSFVVTTCLAKDMMSEEHITYCKQYIYHREASHTILSKLLSRKIFQELVLKMLVDKLDKSFNHQVDVVSTFQTLHDMTFNDIELDKNLPLFLTLFHRSSGLSTTINISIPFISFIKNVVLRLEEQPDLYQAYPNVALFLICVLPIKAHECENDISQMFIQLLKRLDSNQISRMLSILQHRMSRVTVNQKNRLSESCVYQLIVNYKDSLKAETLLAYQCLVSIALAILQDPNFLENCSQQFIENCSDLILYIADCNYIPPMLSYPPIVTLVINRLRQQIQPIQPRRVFLASVALFSLASPLDEENQKYCLEIIKNNYDIPLNTKFFKLKRENALFIEGLFQFLFTSDIITPQTMNNTMVWLQTLVKTGFFDECLQILKKIIEKKLLHLKNLHDCLRSEVFLESQKEAVIELLDKGEKQQLYNMLYDIDLPKCFDKLKSLDKSVQTRIMVPAGAENLDLNLFLKLLEELKLGDQNSPIDIKTFYTDKLQKPEDFKYYMSRMLTNIRTRNPEPVGVPKNPEQRERFYREIEDGLKASLYIILEGIKNNNKEIMDEYPVRLVRMSIAGSKCGKPYQDFSQESYIYYTGRKVETTPDVENQILNALHDFAWKCAKSVIFKNVMNTHRYTAFVKFWEMFLGPQNGSIITQEEEGTAAYIKEIMGKKDQYVQQFSDLFTVDACIEILYNQFEAMANEEITLAYAELFTRYGLTEEEAWGEMMDDPRYGLRKLLEKWNIIKRRS